jgi:Cu+-exporting ATPase
MHCSSCASNVERSIKKVGGVSTCAVNVLSHKAFVECDDSVDIGELKKAVAKVGYKVVDIE